MPSDKHKSIFFLITCIILHVMTLLVSNCYLGKVSDTKSTDYNFEEFKKKYFKLSYFLVPIYTIFTGVSIKYLIKERQDEEISEQIPGFKAMCPYYLLWIIAECLLFFINHVNLYTEQVYINKYDTMIAEFVRERADAKYN